MDHNNDAYGKNYYAGLRVGLGEAKAKIVDAESYDATNPSATGNYAIRFGLRAGKYSLQALRQLAVNDTLTFGGAACTFATSGVS